MLFQQGVPTRFTFTIGWVDLVIMVILIIVFLRWHRAFAPVLLLIVSSWLLRRASGCSMRSRSNR